MDENNSHDIYKFYKTMETHTKNKQGHSFWSHEKLIHSNNEYTKNSLKFIFCVAHRWNKFTHPTHYWGVNKTRCLYSLPLG